MFFMVFSFKLEILLHRWMSSPRDENLMLFSASFDYCLSAYFCRLSYAVRTFLKFRFLSSITKAPSIIPYFAGNFVPDILGGF